MLKFQGLPNVNDNSCAQNKAEDSHEMYLSKNTDFHLFQAVHLKFLFSEINI